MKKLLLFACLTLTSLTTFSQLHFESVADYGKLWNFVYDKTTSDKIYALTYKNHIMASTDNGATWNLFYSFPNANARLFELKMMPSGTAFSFSVEFTYDKALDGLNVLDLASKTIIEHFETPNWDVNPQVSSYSIYDESYDEIVLVSRYSEFFSPFTKVYYTADHGQNWSQIYYNVDFDYVHINQVAFSPANSATIIMTRSNGPNETVGGFYKSTDAGVTWEETLKNFVLDPIAFHPNNPDVILVGSGIVSEFNEEKIFKSSNGGNTWDTLDIAFSEGILDCVNNIQYNPTNPDQIWVLEENEILTSTDAGETWSHKVFPVDSYDYYYGTSMAFDPNNEDRVIIANDIFPLFSTDHATTLQQLKMPLHSTASLDITDYGSSQILYYSTNGGYFEKQLPDGETDRYNVQRPTEYAPTVNYFSGDGSENGRLFIFQSGNFFMPSTFSFSDDFGANTTLILADFLAAMQKVVKDPSTTDLYWAALRLDDFNGRLYRIDISDPTNPEAIDIMINEDGGVVVGVSVSPITGDIVVVKGIKAFKSTDGGLTWVDKSEGLDILNPMEDLIWDMDSNPFNEDEIVLATTKGLYRTTDRGENWEEFFIGFHPREIHYSPYKENVMITSQFGEAALAYTLDNGANWTTVTSEELYYLQVNDVDFLFTEQGIDAFFATPDMGVVRYSIENLWLGIGQPSVPQTSFSVYPNPSNDRINIVTRDVREEVAHVALFDFSGKKVLENTGKVTSLNIAGLNKGMYILKVQTNTGAVSAQKIIKN